MHKEVSCHFTPWNFLSIYANKQSCIHVNNYCTLGYFTLLFSILYKLLGSVELHRILKLLASLQFVGFTFRVHHLFDDFTKRCISRALKVISK